MIYIYTLFHGFLKHISFRHFRQVACQHGPKLNYESIL